MYCQHDNKTDTPADGATVPVDRAGRRRPLRLLRPPIAATVREALQDEGLRATVGGVPVGHTPTGFAAMVREDSQHRGDPVRRCPDR